jgi:hypothetical protein
MKHTILWAVVGFAAGWFLAQQSAASSSSSSSTGISGILQSLGL